MKTLFCLFTALVSVTLIALGADPPKPAFQYKSEGIEVPAATPEEPKVKTFGPETVEAAAKYLDDGAHYWVRERSCLACHSTGVYMVERSALTKQLGKPSAEVLKSFIESRQNDRIGLVVFAGEAYTQCPLTLDYRVLEELLEQVRTGVIIDGTAIGNALATAVNRLRESDAKSRVVILITDGDNNSGNISPQQAAQIARDQGIKVFTILIGKGGRVPYPTGTDLFGRTLYEQVEIDVNPELLEGIAKTTGGGAYQATDRATLESGLAQVLDSLEKSKIYEASAAPSYDEWAARLFLPAAFCALFGLALRSTRLQGAP